MKISKRSKITSSKETADRKTDRRISPTNVRYKGYMIRLDRGGDGYNVYDKYGELEDAGYTSIEKAKEFVNELENESKGSYVRSSIGDHEDDLDHPDQEYDSAATSINSTKLPAIYRMIKLQPGTVGVDFGGGKFDNAVEYLRDQNVTLCVYDPYNRSAEHNRGVLRTLRANGGADFAINSNVLNVIKEPEARKGVLENIKKITKSGAPIYITVYEGRGDAKEGVTKSGYQLNRKTADYLEEIQEVFPDAKRKGKLIVATNSGSVNSSTGVTASSKLWMGKYKSVDGKMHKVYFEFDSLDFEEAEQEFEDIIEEPYTYCRLLGTAPSEKLLQEDGFEKIESSSSISSIHDESVNSSVDIKASSEIIWDDLDWSQQIQVMKRYIRNYKGTRIFEDFADYINKPVEDIIDSFCDAEYRGDIKIPERKQLDSEYRNDDIYSSSSVETRSYGGAYDVDDEYIDSSTDITAAYKLWMGKYKSAKDNKMHKVYFEFDTSDFEEAEQEFEDIIPEPYSYARLLGTAPHESLLQKDGFEKIQSSSSVDANTDEYSDILEEIREQCSTKLIHIMAQYGFDEKEAKQYSRVDASIEDNQYGRIEIGCELDYDSLMRVCQELDLVVQEYDPDSYFEPVDPGIAEAWINLEKASIDSSSNIQAGAYDFPEPSIDPPEYPEPEEVDDYIQKIDLNLDAVIEIDQLGDWEYQDENYPWARCKDTKDGSWYSDEYDVFIADPVSIVERVDELLISKLPEKEGTYRIKGNVHLEYVVSNLSKYVHSYGPDDYEEDIDTDNAYVDFDFYNSNISDFRLTKI